MTDPNEVLRQALEAYDGLQPWDEVRDWMQAANHLAEAARAALSRAPLYWRENCFTGPPPVGYDSWQSWMMSPILERAHIQAWNGGFPTGPVTDKSMGPLTDCDGEDSYE